MAEEVQESPQSGGVQSSPPPKEEGIPAWMATFADMVTLLLCFFVLLLSFTNQDITNFKQMMGSIQSALGVQKEDRTALSTPYAESSFKARRSVRESREIIELGARLKRFIRAKDLSSMARVSSDKSGVMLRFDSSVMFDKGKASLAPESRKALAVVIKGMENKNFNLIIRGHTDGEQVESHLYDSNWELSAARAAGCLRYTSAKPILPSTTEANKRANRRVEFFYIPVGRSKW